jgi:hypothetical protein
MSSPLLLCGGRAGSSSLPMSLSSYVCVVAHEPGRLRSILTCKFYTAAVIL